MQRIFSAIFGLLCMLPFNVFAKGDVKYDDGGSCIVWKRSAAANRFWFCGSKQDECKDVKVRSGSSVTTMSHGDIHDDFRPYETHDHYAFMCCTNGEAGARFIIHTANSQKPDQFPNTSQTKDLKNGGTCQQTINACGEVVTDCDSASDCPEGTFQKTIDGKAICAEPCSAGQGYANDHTVDCVECPTNKSQGVNNSNVCVYCSAGEVFNIKQKKCMALNSTNFNTYSKSEIQRCWKCPSDTDVLQACFDKRTGNDAHDWENKCE